MIGWTHIGVEGREVWAYVGADHIEAHERPDGIPTRATIGAVEMLIQVTRISAGGFEADILGRAPVAEPIPAPIEEEPAAPEQEPAPAEQEEETHGE